MKNIFFTLIVAFLIVTNSFSQQIGDGRATEINNFTVPLRSGLYQGLGPVGAIPDLSYGGWQHLFVVRHSNDQNNYELQIASSYENNDRLFFRKIAGGLEPNNPSWVELATRGANNFSGNQSITGKLGIGTLNPTSNLEIVESNDSRPGGQSAPAKSILKLSRNGTENYSYNENAEFRIGHGGNSIYGSKLDLYVNGSTNTTSVPDQHVMTWNYNGNVGIGTTNPTSMLTVAGNINSREVKVTVDAGADFVFHENYQLPSLDFVDKYVKENKHLPEIASANEMQKEGINLSEMNIKLLQKVEELTLYVIQQQKNSNKLAQIIEEQNTRLKLLEERKK